MNDLVKSENQMAKLDEQTVAIVSATIKEILSPVLASLADFMARNTEAMERLAAQQKIQSDRLEALEKQIRLNTPVTPTQVRHINSAIRIRARALLAKKMLDEDKKAVNALSSAIRKAVLARYGVAALNEIPRHEYNITMNQIDTWNDTVVMLDITRDARKRNSASETTNKKAYICGEDKEFSGLVDG